MIHPGARVPSRARIGLALVLAPAALGAAGPFGPSPSAPADYVMEKTSRHSIVLLGEAHWIRHDALLVAEIVPRLAERRIVLAMETLRAGDQTVIDRLLSGPEWDEAAAMRLMRSAAWPYREYLDILREAWEANRATAGSMRVVALAPEPDWRDTLLRAKRVSYDAFMADLVAAEIAAGRRVLVYCGIHHAFTRYHQPELDLEGHARAFFDRTGNILRRRFGERVFLITLHRPVKDVENGVRLRFENSAGLLAELVRVVDQERSCCNFLRFQLTAEPENGPII